MELEMTGDRELYNKVIIVSVFNILLTFRKEKDNKNKMKRDRCESV